MLVDEVSHTFQTGQLQAVGVSEGKALHSSGTVVSGLGCLDLVVEEDDLGTSPPEDLVGGTELADNSISIGIHCDRGWFVCDVQVAVISRDMIPLACAAPYISCCRSAHKPDASSERRHLSLLAEFPHLYSFAKCFSHLSSLAALVVHSLAARLSTDIIARMEISFLCKV